ncbi:hypothetical protein BDR03DRAFT_952097 [Suillus americanus]|nr:hypothetical protein BDR03DRAFT_952097 [Suillus americanus]
MVCVCGPQKHSEQLEKYTANVGRPLIDDRQTGRPLNLSSKWGLDSRNNAKGFQNIR